MAWRRGRMARKNKKQEIIAAAERLFASRRFHEVTTDDIVREAKVGKGTLYKYFEDKDELFLETVHSGFAELCEVLRKEVPEEAPFEKQLLAACASISAFFERKHRMMRMVLSEVGPMPAIKVRLRERFAASRAELVSAIAGILGRGVKAGEIRRDIAPEVLASFLLGMIRTRGRELKDTPASLRSYELMIDLFRNGASARHSAAVRGGRSARN